MRYLHSITKRYEFIILSRAVRTIVPAVLILCAALPALVLSAQDQETAATPLNREALVAAAGSALEAGRFNEALRLYGQIEKHFGSYSSLYRHRGIAREMLGDDRKAIEDFKLAVKADSNDYESLEHLGSIYERGGTRDREAIVFYKRALELDPRPEWKDNLAVWIAMLESRLQPEEATAVGCWHLGNEKSRKGDYAAAESLYSRAIELNPHLFQAYFSRGLIHLKAGEANAALVDFEETVRMVPDFAQAFLQRGLAREQLGNIKEAYADFERAAKMDARDPAALYHSAKAREAEDDYETALKLYHDALRCRPSLELSAAIRERISALGASPRIRKARNSGGHPEAHSLW
jgi:tetratricopeptide (TPR) repeat protein